MLIQLLKTIRSMVDEAIRTLEKPEIDRDRLHRNLSPFLAAVNEIGVKELPGKASNNRIELYHKYSTLKNHEGVTDDVPWCASFIAFCLESVGMGSTNSKLARSYLDWGVSVKNHPLPGDIVVFWREAPDSYKGHVGFYVKSGKEGIYVLGGNQSDAVNIKAYSKLRLLDIRRSSKAPGYSDAEKEFLLRQADIALS